MRAAFSTVGSAALLVLAACSGDAAKPSGVAPNVIAPSASAKPAHALFTFEGSFKAATQTLSVVARAPSGADSVKGEATLPYGPTSGNVLFHTCGVSYSLGAHQLTGNVKAVNQMSGDIGAFNAVIDSISVTGILLGSGSGSGSPSGIIASYGTVSPNAIDCVSAADRLTWAFAGDTNDTDFTFTGHAEGTPAGAGTSCADILSQNPGAPSGTYTIAPSSGPLYQAFCDMTTDGGGWTLVFVPSAGLENSSTIPYSVTDAALLGSATDVLMAYRDSSFAVLPHRATFPMPTHWRTQSPFEYQDTDEGVSVSIDGAAATASTLRYGFSNFGTLCTDAWTTAQNYGRVCIESSLAPFYSGFDFSTFTGGDANNFCCNSSQGYNATACSANLRFTLAVR